LKDGINMSEYFGHYYFCFADEGLIEEYNRIFASIKERVGNDD